MKKWMIAILSAVMACSALVFTGCEVSWTVEEKDAYNVGIIKLVDHVALNAAEDGFKDKLTALLAEKDKTVTFDSKDGSGDMTMLSTIASTFAASNNDLILSIATDAATAMASACENKPILFTAVTDAEEAKLVKKNAKPGANVSGTSDMNPIKQQVELMKELLPGIKKIAVLYTTSEKNSLVQVNLLQAECDKQGVTLVKKGITHLNDIQDAFTALSTDSSIELVYIPTDNTLAKGVAAVHTANTESSRPIPVMCGETGMNDTCGVATYGIDYYKLGEQTAEMAYRILVEGADVSKMAVEYQSGEPVLTVNAAAAADIGFTIPQTVLDKVAA